MNYLNSQQLAFILDIKKEDARAKMCNAWEKDKGIEKVKTITGPALKGAELDPVKKKIKDDYPLAMPVKMLSEQLNLPSLQSMVDDIVNNYLIRPASKKYILCDYPEKLVLKAKEEGKKPKAKIPAAKRFIQFRPEYTPA